MSDKMIQRYTAAYPGKTVLIYNGVLDVDFRTVDMVVFDYTMGVDEAWEAGAERYVGLVDTVLVVDHPRNIHRVGQCVAKEAEGYEFSEEIKRGITVYSNSDQAAGVLSGAITLSEDTLVETTETEYPASSTTLPPQGFSLNICTEDDEDDQWCEVEGDGCCGGGCAPNNYTDTPEVDVYPPEDWDDSAFDKEDWK